MMLWEVYVGRSSGTMTFLRLARGDTAIEGVEEARRKALENMTKEETNASNYGVTREMLEADHVNWIAIPRDELRHGEIVAGEVRGGKQ